MTTSVHRSSSRCLTTHSGDDHGRIGPGRRAFGTDSELEAFSVKLTEVLQKMKRKNALMCELSALALSRDRS